MSTPVSGSFPMTLGRFTRKEPKPLPAPPSSSSAGGDTVILRRSSGGKQASAVQPVDVDLLWRQHKDSIELIAAGVTGDSVRRALERSLPTDAGEIKALLAHTVNGNLAVQGEARSLLEAKLPKTVDTSASGDKRFSRRMDSKPPAAFQATSSGAGGGVDPEFRDALRVANDQLRRTAELAGVDLDAAHRALHESPTRDRRAYAQSELTDGFSEEALPKPSVPQLLKSTTSGNETTAPISGASSFKRTHRPAILPGQVIGSLLPPSEKPVPPPLPPRKSEQQASGNFVADYEQV